METDQKPSNSPLVETKLTVRKKIEREYNHAAAKRTLQSCGFQSRDEVGDACFNSLLAMSIKKWGAIMPKNPHG